MDTESRIGSDVKCCKNQELGEQLEYNSREEAAGMSIAKHKMLWFRASPPAPGSPSSKLQREKCGALPARPSLCDQF